MAKRLVEFDLLKGVGILSVVLGHSAISEPLHEMIYSYHMPLFFMLSGAVLALKPLKAFNIFVKSKVKRLLVPYYVYGLIFMLPIKYVGHFYNEETIDFGTERPANNSNNDCTNKTEGR